MPKRREPIILSWSGGKDSAMALWELRKSADHEVTHLLTVITEDDERITMHGVQRSLVEQQAESLGLPIEIVAVPRGASNSVYCERLGQALTGLRDQGLRAVAYGDLFLDDLRDFREEHLERLDMQALFPLWHRDTQELAYAFLNSRFKAVVTCVDEKTLDPSLVGRLYDRSFLADLPLCVDPCGENGEFHTFVYDGPLFRCPVPVKSAGERSADSFRFCDLASCPEAVRGVKLRRSTPRRG